MIDLQVCELLTEIDPKIAAEMMQKVIESMSL